MNTISVDNLKQKTIHHNKTVRTNQWYYGTRLQKTKLINIMVKIIMSDDSFVTIPSD